jgi:acetyltransferase-like isoleucine patch superfamily enzyme
MSYGFINLEKFNNPNEKLFIGDYVSIANKVVFILGGNHQTNTISNYPFYSKLIKLKPGADSLTKGPIIIENEVWIGYGALILSGVRIGKGAIIAAGSVVTKDVPAYSIVGGNPARLIKYRFNEEIIKNLIDFNISNLDESEIIDNIDFFYHNLDINKIEEFKNILTPNIKE